MIIYDNNKNIKNVGQYKVVKTLHENSGYSDVYLVEDSKDANKKYALKAIKDSSEKYKIQNEININKIVSSCKNTINLARVFEDSNRYFFLFEYAHGQDLKFQVKNHGLFDEEKVLDMLKDMVLILKFTHNQKIIHNDIKPSNILENGGKYFLCDWGLSVNKKEDETLHIRTDVSYVAPEIFYGKFDSNSDIYSLGCTLYYLTTGKKPYELDDKSVYSYAMFAHCCLNIDISEIKSDKLRYLISKMTQKNPADRISLNEIENIIKSSDSFTNDARKIDYDIFKNKSSFELYEQMVEKNILFAYKSCSCGIPLPQIASLLLDASIGVEFLLCTPSIISST